MFLSELRKFAEMTFLMEHLTTKLRLGHNPVKMGRDDPVKRTENMLSAYQNRVATPKRTVHRRLVRQS